MKYELKLVTLAHDIHNADDYRKKFPRSLTDVFHIRSMVEIHCTFIWCILKPF